ncbi:hypothetical protein GS531_00570 [Rhodococcus hoagii]|nr:hypothetical protein [Prescottella equi]
MSAGALVDLGMRFAALDLGQPVPAVQYQQQHVRPDARIISLMAMSGDHVGLWGVAIGTAELPRPKMLVVADPRRRDEQTAVWRFLAEQLGSYLRWCDGQSMCPQIVVADEQCWSQLVAGAHRYAWSRDATLSSAAAAITVLAERVESAGQQAVVMAREVLDAHAMTGADPDQQRDLQALLAWHAPRADRQPSGIAADDGDCVIPEDLDTEISPLAKRLRRTERHSGVRAIETCRASLATLVEPVLAARWTRIVEALSALAALDLPLLPGLEEMAADDNRDWQRWAARRAEGKHPLRPSVRSAMVALVAREYAAARWTHHQLRHDEIVYTRAEFSGEALTLTDLEWSSHSVVGHSARAPRLRVGDVVVRRSAVKEKFTVLALEDVAAGAVRVTLERTASAANSAGAECETLQLLPGSLRRTRSGSL